MLGLRLIHSFKLFYRTFHYLVKRLPISTLVFCSWRVGGWGNCTHSCGEHGKQERTLNCVTDYYGDDMAVDNAYCDHSQMPDFIRPCNRGIHCLSDWHVGDWSPVSFKTDFNLIY